MYVIFLFAVCLFVGEWCVAIDAIDGGLRTWP